MRCDGLVVSTPAGSTGYNLANGGPVMAWGVEGFVVSFIAPHSLTARALVVAPSDVLRSTTARASPVDVVARRAPGRASWRRGEAHRGELPARGRRPGPAAGLVVLPPSAREVRAARVMRVVVAGGHGQIARRLERLLAERGDEAVGLVRNPDHVADVEATGARALVLDLESATVDDLVEAVRGADAVVFAAGAGPGSGPARKRTVDLGAAVALLDAAEAAGVRRYVMVELDRRPGPVVGAAPQMQPYLEAKAEADEALTQSELDWTVVRARAA